MKLSKKELKLILDNFENVYMARVGFTFVPEAPWGGSSYDWFEVESEVWLKLLLKMINEALNGKN